MSILNTKYRFSASGSGILFLDQAAMSRQSLRFFQIHVPCALLLAFCVLSGPVGATDLSAADPYQMNRAGRWQDVINHFRRRSPARTTDRYILARAHDRLARKNKAAGGGTHLDLAFRNYLGTAGLRCRSTAGQDQIRACLGGLKAASKRGLIERLALWKASELARDFNYTSLPQRLLLGADLSDDDPLSHKIYHTRMKALLADAPASVSLKLAKSYPELSSPMVDLFRARALSRSGEKTAALNYVLRAGESTSVGWLQKAIYGEVRKSHADLLTDANLARRSRNNRRLLALATYLNFKELKRLGASFPAPFVTQTSTIQTVHTDGIFLIRSGQAAALPSLVARHRNFLNMEPAVLYAWARMLRQKKQLGTMVRLVRAFPNAKRQHQGLWREYLRHLKTVNRDNYFVELVDYLNYFGANYHDNDKLIEFLIGDDTLHIQWAPERYWRQAYKKLEPHTWNGRFLYWLRRFHVKHGRPEEARKLEDTFYARAPGSYYAAAFWKPGDTGDFRGDWQKVLNRKSYLWWISRHGGNLKAVHFMARKNLTRYLDPEAVRFWSEMRRKQYRIPGAILDLNYLGETDLGKAFYDDVFAGKLPRREHLARRAYIGHKTGNLNIQVYFTRELVRSHLIPEDPFSLPAGLLERLYPRPYLRTVRKFSGQYRIPAAMVYALMRQESLFRETAISRSGARGLMQVMPATGAWLFKGMRMTPRDLLEPEVSIQLGAKYFSDMLRQHGQDFRWASIAYNGGPGNLRKWKRKYYQNDFNLFLEKLPVAEPRNYCRITYQNYMHYRITYMLYP